MVKMSQHPAGVGCQVKLKMWNFYLWLILFGFIREIYCADAANGKKFETHAISTTSLNDDASSSQSYTEESFLDEFSDKKSDFSELYRFSRAVPRLESGKASDKKPKNHRKPDYVLKIPLALLRQYDLYRLLWLQEHEDTENLKRRDSIIPFLSYDRLGNENEYDTEGIYNILPHLNSEEDNLTEDFLDESFKEANNNIFPFVRNSRSMLLLSSPKSDDTTKEKVPQTFVLPYPRPGRANKYEKIGKAKNGQLILPYPRPGRSRFQNKDARTHAVSSNKQKYILPFARLGRSSFDSNFGKYEDIIIDDWIASSKSNPSFLKMNKEKVSDSATDENEGNSLFVIPYPRPGKRSTFKLKNRNQEAKNPGKEMSDYVLPYPRPGKKSGKEKLTKFLLNKNKGAENIGSQSSILPYPRPGRNDETSLGISDLYETSSILNKKQNIDVDKIIEQTSSEIMPAVEDEILIPIKKFENRFILPYLRTGRNFDKIVPYPRPGRSYPYRNEASNLISNDIDTAFNKFQLSQMGLENLDYPASDNLRFKRSASVVPYPRLGRSNVVPYPKLGRSNIVVPYSKSTQSNSVVPYPRLGSSDSVVPYPRLGRSNSVVPYPRIGKSDATVPYPKLSQSASIASHPRLKRSNSVVPYPRLGRSNFLASYPYFDISKRSSSVVPYPRLGRSDFVVPYPRPGRSDSLVPYPRPGRTESVVPYPRLGRVESIVPYPRPGRAESIVPYPRPGRAVSIVPYPRPGRAESIVSYPRPGRAESIVPYPRPGRSESIVAYPRPGRSEFVVPYPRPGRSDSVVPYPRPGRSDSVVPYPRLGRSHTGEIGLTDKYDKTESWFLPNLETHNSNLKEDISSTIGYLAQNSRNERSITEDHIGFTDANSNLPNEENTIIRYDRASNGQGYVLPHPRIGRSLLHDRRKRKSIDTDTVIPYPRLGRSEEEIIPQKSSPEIQNSVHKLNKHMLTSVDDSVYLLPYPRPGRYLE